MRHPATAPNKRRTPHIKQKKMRKKNLHTNALDFQVKEGRKVEIKEERKKKTDIPTVQTHGWVLSAMGFSKMLAAWVAPMSLIF